MKRNRLALTGSFLALSLAAWPVAAQDQPKTTRETVGEKFDDAVQSIKRGAKEAGETLQQQYDKARTSIHNMGVSGRVYGRLHWDKDLQAAKIELDVKENGVATLTGTVPDIKARAKALTLTMDTVGVVRVIDHLSISISATPTETVTGPTGTTTTTTKEITKP